MGKGKQKIVGRPRSAVQAEDEDDLDSGEEGEESEAAVPVRTQSRRVKNAYDNLNEAIARWVDGA